jgi:hypothetical protein
MREAQVVIARHGRRVSFGAQTVLHDAMGGPDATVDATGKATITAPPGGAVVLAPEIRDELRERTKARFGSSTKTKKFLHVLRPSPSPPSCPPGLLFLSLSSLQ